MSSPALRRVLIDTDTASDDAVALIMALRSPYIQVEAITTVAGNVPVGQGTANALYTAELCASHVPVFEGAGTPLLRRLETAHWFHGKDGLGDHGYAPASRNVESEHAVQTIQRLIKTYPGIEIVTLGPLTNLATALLQNPSLVHNVSRCVIMGGAPCTEGNVTPAAEFNIWVDPEAARIVFRSGLPIEMIGWQLCRGTAVVNEEEVKSLLNLGSPLADFAVHSNSVAMQAYRVQTGEVGISLPDPVAMSVLIDPSLALHSSTHFVEIEVNSELTRGMTVVDKLNVAGNSRNSAVWSYPLERDTPASICWQLDIPGWKRSLFAAFTSSAVRNTATR